MKEVMITSADNPYNPFKDFDSWLKFDMFKGYRTCERLASICFTSDQLSDEENQKIIDDAINELMRHGGIDKNGNIIEYVKVYKDSDNENEV